MDIDCSSDEIRSVFLGNAEDMNPIQDPSSRARNTIPIHKMALMSTASTVARMSYCKVGLGLIKRWYMAV